ARHQPRHDPDRSALLQMQRPSRPCLRGRPRPDRPALLHQLGCAETRAQIGRLVPSLEPAAPLCFARQAKRSASSSAGRLEGAMSLGTVLIILVIIYLIGGFSGRFGGYGYGMGHSGIGIGGVILVVLIVLLLLGKL